MVADSLCFATRLGVSSLCYRAQFATLRLDAADIVMRYRGIIDDNAGFLAREVGANGYDAAGNIVDSANAMVGRGNRTYAR